MAGHHSNAFQTMNEQRKNGELCDFKIEVEGKTIQVHRVALASCSKYFRKIFNTPMRESNEGVCQLKDTTAKVAEICVNFIYTGEMDIAPDIAVEILKLSHLWQLDKAVDICVKVMSKNLASTNCISILKIGKLYSLQTLSDNCIRYILSHVSSMVKEAEDLDWSDMQGILEYGTEEGRTPCEAMELWNFCQGWGSSIHYSAQYCAIVKLFPVERLSYALFFGNVWENSHFRECENCRQNAGKRYINSGPTITVENCLFLKHLVNCYGGGPNTLTDFIVNQSEAVFARPEFVWFSTEENLMDYVSRLGKNRKRCSRAEFAGIISWLKFDNSRKLAFPKIFPLQIFHDWNNDFLVSVNTFDEQIATVEDALFIMKLFDEHSSTGLAGPKALNFAIMKFPEATKLPEFSDITLRDLKTCISIISSTDRVDEKKMWDGIMMWINFDPNQRKNKFPDIFSAIRLEKFSSEFLQQTVCESELVAENKSCISGLLEFMFKKFENQDEVNKSNEARISVLEKRIMKS